MRNITAVSMPALILSACMLMPTQEVRAHPVIDNGRFYHNPAFVHFGHRYTTMPGWLRRHRDFVFWYRLNHAYYPVDVSWRRLFRRYERDYYYQRHYKSKKYKRHYKSKKWAKYRKKRNKREARRHRYYDD